MIKKILKIIIRKIALIGKAFDKALDRSFRGITKDQMGRLLNRFFNE